MSTSEMQQQWEQCENNKKNKSFRMVIDAEHYWLDCQLR